MIPLLLACVVAIVCGAIWVLGGRWWTPEPVSRPEGKPATLLARDSSGNGNDAIIQGAVELGLPGRHGNAFSFDARDAWLMVPPSPDLNPEDRDFLVSAWVALRENPGRGETYDVVRKGISYTGRGEYILEVLRHGRVRCTAMDNQQRVAAVTTTGVDVIDGHWHLLGCARTGRLWSVLADDTITSRRTDLGAVGNEVALSLGGKYGMEDRPDGRVDDLKIVVGQHSEDQPPLDTEDAVASSIDALDEQRPVGWWRLDESPNHAPEP